MRAPASEEGFALVESIGALFVSALIVATLGMTMGLVVQFSATIARQTNEADVLTSGIAAVRRDLSGALAIAADADPKGAVLFQGSSLAVGFATASEVVWIEAAAKKGSGALMRSGRPLLPGVQGLGPPDHRGVATLLSGPWTFRFSFAAFQENDGAWIGEWIGRDRLPDLIKLDVFRTDETGRPVMSLVEAPRTRWKRRCTFDDPPSCLARPIAVEQP